MPEIAGSQACSVAANPGAAIFWCLGCLSSIRSLNEGLFAAMVARLPLLFKSRACIRDLVVHGLDVIITGFERVKP